MRKVALNGNAISRKEEKMRKENGETNAARLMWELFERTGSVSYYMLYHELTDKNAKK